MSDVRLIDANVMRDEWLENGENEHVYDTNAVLASIDGQPTIEAVPVVRCRDCKYSVCIFKAHFVGCDMWKQATPKDGFCHMGEKMDAKDMDVPTEGGGEVD